MLATMAVSLCDVLKVLEIAAWFCCWEWFLASHRPTLASGGEARYLGLDPKQRSVRLSSMWALNALNLSRQAQAIYYNPGLVQIIGLGACSWLGVKK